MTSVLYLTRVAFPLVTLMLANTRTTSAAICEPIRISMCHWLPYNLTRMPNLLFHSSQTNAKLILESYQPLVDTKCSDVLLFFLCTMFVPMCPANFQQDNPHEHLGSLIPPCRGVCQRAREGCEPVLQLYNVSWPAGLECDNLPQFDRGVCISPDSIIGPPTVQPVIPVNTSAVAPPATVPRCLAKSSPAKTKLKELFTSSKYSYAMTAVYDRVEHLDDGSLMLYMSPRLVFYHKRVPAGPGVTRIWVPEGCLQRRLKPARSYLIMGTENKSKKRLLLKSDSYVAVWRPNTLKRLKKWNYKMIRGTPKIRGRLFGRRRISRRRHGKSRNKKQRQKHNNARVDS